MARSELYTRVDRGLQVGGVVCCVCLAVMALVDPTLPDRIATVSVLTWPMAVER